MIRIRTKTNYWKQNKIINERNDDKEYATNRERERDPKRCHQSYWDGCWVPSLYEEFGDIEIE